MVILWDVGNTAVTYGIYGGGRFQGFGSCVHNDIPKLIKKWSKSGLLYNSNVVLSSVVPNITLNLKKSLKTVKGTKLWVLGQNLPVSIRSRYSKKLGMDRIINIYGALRMYKPPFVIIDFGTAITVDYVSARGAFEGGMIIPGPEVAFQALIEKAALLPKKLRLPRKRKTLLGNNTYDCMSSGILEGYGAMMDGLTRRLKDKFGKNTRIIATGGFSPYLKPFTSSFDILDTRHSIKSLLMIYKDSLKKKPA